MVRFGRSYILVRFDISCKNICTRGDSDGTKHRSVISVRMSNAVAKKLVYLLVAGGLGGMSSTWYSLFKLNNVCNPV